MKPFFTLITSLFLLSINPFIGINGYADEPSPEAPQSSFVYGEIDYLLWFANQDELQTPTVSTGSFPELGSRWGSGVRAGIGLAPPYCDTKLYYSYYSTRASATASANIETILSSTPSTTGIFEVGTNWTLDFNRIDWELGKKLLFDHFALRPFFGLEGLYTTQKLVTTTNTIFLDLSTGLPATDLIRSDNKNRFLSIGTRAGFNTNFDLGAGFEFYGDFSGSLLWGNFRIKQKYTQTDVYAGNLSIEVMNKSQQLSQNGSIFNYDLGIGFNWKHSFPKQKFELLLKLGWEQHYFADIVRFQDFYLQQTSLGTAAYLSRGNLALSGVVCGIFLGF